MDEVCRTCAFCVPSRFQPELEHGIGHCHYAPPVIVVIHRPVGSKARTQWPRVEMDLDFCSEWKPGPDAPRKPTPRPKPPRDVRGT